MQLERCHACNRKPMHKATEYRNEYTVAHRCVITNQLFRLRTYSKEAAFTTWNHFNDTDRHKHNAQPD